MVSNREMSVASAVKTLIVKWLEELSYGMNIMFIRLLLTNNHYVIFLIASALTILSSEDEKKNLLSLCMKRLFEI